MIPSLPELLLTSSVLILGVTALRYLLRGRVSPRLQYALWALVLVRLLVPLPVTVQSHASVMYPAREAVHYVQTHAPSRTSAPGNGGLDTPAPAPAQAGAPASGAAAPEPAARSFPAAALPILWAVGAISVGAWFALSNLRFSAMLRRRRVSLDGRFAGLPLPVYAVDGLSSPCLFGLFRPAVYLPEHCLDNEAALRHILAHELTHWRQKDVFWSLLRGVCLALYWFDPLVWLAAVLSRRDCELSCDAGAIRRIGEDERIAYGRTLLSLMARSTGPGTLLCAATTMSAGARSRRERIALIARRPRMKAATVALTVLLALLCAACTFTGAPEDSGSGEGLRNDDFPGKVLYEVYGLTIPVPEEALDGLVVRTGEDADLEGRGMGLISLYDKTAWEDTLTEYGEEGGGWIISLTVMSEASYEQYLMNDSSGLYCFARDDEGNYFFRCTPTDVRIMDDARRDATQDIADELMNDFFQANKDRLVSISPSDFFSREYTFDSVEHRYVTFAPYGAARPERWGIVLSHPMRNGDGAIWCVDRWVDDNGGTYPYFPDPAQPSREYYADLQRAYDENPADHADLTDPEALARQFLTGYLGLGADVGEIVEVSETPPEWFTESVRRNK